MTSAKYGSISVLFFLCFSFMGLSAQGITVTAPAPGAQVCKGKATVITWVKSGNTEPTVKIRLYDKTVSSKLLDIADAVPNSGSFTWTVPNSLPDGQYVVRVRTLGEGISDDSDVFSIKTCGVQSALDRGVQKKNLPEQVSVEGSGLKMVDLEIIDIERQTGSGVLSAKVRNLGNAACSRDLTFHIFYQGLLQGPVTVPVNLAAGAVQDVNLLVYLSPRDMVVRNSVLVKIKVDANNQILEKNEQNNEFSKTINRTCSYYIERFSVEVNPSQSQGPYPLPNTLIVQLDYIGQGEVEISGNTTNNGTFIRKVVLSSAGTYRMEMVQVPISRIFLIDSSHHCGDHGYCTTIKAWIKNPMADGGVNTSNPVSCNYQNVE